MDYGLWIMDYGLWIMEMICTTKRDRNGRDAAALVGLAPAQARKPRPI
jgi:hypothetical protein